MVVAVAVGVTVLVGVTVAPGVPVAAGVRVAVAVGVAVAVAPGVAITGEGTMIIAWANIDGLSGVWSLFTSCSDSVCRPGGTFVKVKLSAVVTA